MQKQLITLTPAAYELLLSQIEAMPYALAKSLLQLLKSNAQPLNIDVEPPAPAQQEGGGG